MKPRAGACPRRTGSGAVDWSMLKESGRWTLLTLLGGLSYRRFPLGRSRIRRGLGRPETLIRGRELFGCMGHFRAYHVQVAFGANVRLARICCIRLGSASL